jgi:PT repeat
MSTMKIFSALSTLFLAFLSPARASLHVKSTALVTPCFYLLALPRFTLAHIQLRGRHDDHQDGVWPYQADSMERMNADSIHEGIHRRDGVLDLPAIDDNADCPQKDPALSTCDVNSYSEVHCGPHNCYYRNRCLAEYLDWNVNQDCMDATQCPIPPETLQCGLSPIKYTCGLADCDYDSECAAKAMNWDTDGHFCTSRLDCTPTTIPISCVIVPRYAYYCGANGACIYQNNCDAIGAGWDIDQECTAMDLCNAVSPDANCAKSRDVYICTVAECQYDSKCEAEDAGYVVYNDCTTYNTCPAVATGYPCTSYASGTYICGDPPCYYNTICEIQSTTWDFTKDCTIDGCPNVFNTGGCGISRFEYTCGSSTCRYGSGCEAERAGWDISSTDCIAKAICPLILASSCSEEPGVKYGCGKDYSCIYDSKCHVTEVEWDDITECRIVGCPTPPQGVVCPFGFEVECGPDNCKYNNMCEAKSIGWNTDRDCTELKVCTRSGIIITDTCTEASDPVVCAVDESTTCQYSSSCKAEAVGWDTSQDCVRISSPPSQSPSNAPSETPTKAPTRSPTRQPTNAPTKEPTRSPTRSPTNAPTKEPTRSPTRSPTATPTKMGSAGPVPSPTLPPTKSPTASPIQPKTTSPTRPPTRRPTNRPTSAANCNQSMSMKCYNNGGPTRCRGKSGAC